MKTIIITITINDISLKDWLTSPWKIRPTKWGKRHFKKVSSEFVSYRYIPKIKYLRTKAELYGFELGLKETKEIVDKMIEKGFIQKNPKEK